MNGKTRQIAHGVNAVRLQPAHGAGAGHPEVGQWAVVPEQIAVGFFIQFGNAHTILVRWDMLCHNVHGQLCQIQVCADARCGRDPCILQYIPD